MNIRLSIIIVSWNVCKDLIQCLQSIGDHKPSFDYEVIVVDNHSRDDTLEQIRGRFPDVIVIANEDNRGFAAANNQALSRAGGEYILFLNPDTMVCENALDRMVEFLEKNSDIGILGPQLLNADRTVQRSVREFPTLRALFHRYTIIRYLGIYKSCYRKWMMRDFTHSRIEDVDQVMGAVLLIRSEILQKLGGFRNEYFMYYEEVDLCFRVKQMGYRVTFFPEARIVHTGGRSASQIPAKKRYMTLNSLMIFLRKNYPGHSIPVFIFFFKILLMLRYLVDTLKYSLKCLWFAITNNRSELSRSWNNVKDTVQFILIYYWKLLISTGTGK